MQNSRDEFLDHLFAVYRELLGDYEAGPSFIAEVWAKIEARRREQSSWLTYLLKWAPRLAVSAAAIAALLTASLWIQSAWQRDSELLDASYVDVLMLDSIDEQDGAIWMVARNGK